jgi:hypothetical protein
MVVAVGCGASPAGTSSPTDDGGPTALDAASVETAGEDAPGETATPGDAATDLARDEVSEDDRADALVVIPAAFTEENAPMRILEPGDAIELIRPPQGGHVVLLAAQVRNMNTNAATIRVRMRRPDTGFIVAEEKRTVAMVPVPGEAATMQPDLRSRSQVSHVPLCPDYDAIDIDGQPLDVEVQVTALYTDPPKIGSARLGLVPTCRQTTPGELALCRCECEANYTLGKCLTDAEAPLRVWGQP